MYHIFKPGSITHGLRDMLWYLLSPFRGTSQPPRLSASHPIRRAFYRHGKTTAQHWLVAMLVSVAIAMAFSYPTVLRAENPTAGFAAYPHHVWTTAKPYDGDPDQADVEMRQVWIHGSYMKALEKNALMSGLDIQQTLVGSGSLSTVNPSLSESLRSGTLSWGYHSPLMYWNNSRELIKNDDDILRTINGQARSTSSSLNVTLRPASVFAGKKFSHQKLVAADALVITLMNKARGAAGGDWQRQLKSLTTGTCKDCTFFPKDGHVNWNKAYEVSFTPLSVNENIALTFAYSFVALYVLLSLRRIKAFHSRFGLVITAITQMTCSILASFTICGILKINLSMIPQNAYPFVVLVMGIENMFRLINAVLAYPPTMATDLRIANALGDVGPVSTATAAQNLAILALLSRVVSPGVAAFCVFASIASLFDAFFLLTFFVAVLNVDIRRFELQDALARANQKHKRKASPAQNHTWFDALVHGRLPFSTRMAGTATTTTFILSLNYHFFEYKENATSLRHLIRLIKDGPSTLNEFDNFASPPINASLTPSQWMRMQDFDTTKEILRLAKPGSDSFIVRVFAPLIVVLSGADRTDMDVEKAWTTVLRSLAMHHFYPVAVAVVFAVAFVAVLMNFLLYTEHEDELSFDPDQRPEESFKVETIALPHRLDVVKLSASGRGHLVTVGLDRTIAILTVDKSENARRLSGLSTDALAMIRWPVHSITLDDGGEWMACHCADDRVLIYCCATASFIGTWLTYLDDNPPILFQFVRLPVQDGNQLYFVLLTSSGYLSMANIETGECTTAQLAVLPILGAHVQEPSTCDRRLVLITDQADMWSCTWTDGVWVQSISQTIPIQTLHGRMTGDVRISQDPALGSDILIVTTSRQVILLESLSLQTLGTLDASQEQRSIINVIFGQTIQCPACGSVALRSAALVGHSWDDCECAVSTLHANAEHDAFMCLSGSTKSCAVLPEAERSQLRLLKPGVYGITSEALLGLRKPMAQRLEGIKECISSMSTRLKRRRQANAKQAPTLSEDVWEAYRLSADGRLDVLEVQGNNILDSQDHPQLFVTSAGPAITLDEQSVAIAFGNAITIIKSVRRASMARRLTGRALERRPANLKDPTRLRRPQ